MGKYYQLIFFIFSLYLILFLINLSVSYFLSKREAEKCIFWFFPHFWNLQNLENIFFFIKTKIITIFWMNIEKNAENRQFIDFFIYDNMAIFIASDFYYFSTWFIIYYHLSLFLKNLTIFIYGITFFLLVIDKTSQK